MKLLIAFIIVVVVLLIWYKTHHDTLTSSYDGRTYNVVASYEDKHEAAELLARVNTSLLEFMRYLKKQYHIDETDEEIISESSSHSTMENSYVHKLVDHLLTNYNPEVVYENDPKWAGSGTSYTLDKGAKMYLCIRSKKPPYSLIDYNTLMFCALHEISHIAAFDVWGHPDKFWAVFKFILHEASTFGIYTPIKYDEKPVDYCGLTVNYQPLYDPSLPSYWLGEDFKK